MQLGLINMRDTALSELRLAQAQFAATPAADYPCTLRAVRAIHAADQRGAAPDGTLYPRRSRASVYLAFRLARIRLASESYILGVAGSSAM